MRADGVWAAPPAGGSPPTGTGFRHITSGVEDAAAKLVDTADVNNDQITFAKLQNISGSTRFVGRFSTGAGDAEDLSGASATQMLSQFTSGAQGVVTGSGGGTTNFLRADGSWAAPGGGGPTTKSKGNTQSSTSGTALIEVGGLSFSLTSGVTYQYEFYVRFASSVTTTGIRLGVSYPAANWSTIYSLIPIAANGTASHLEGQITVSGGSVTGTGVAVVNTDYQASIIGTINPSASGNLTVHFGSEIAGTTVTIKSGSLGKLFTI